MKKIIAAGIICLAFTACTDSAKTNDVTTTTTTTDTTSIMDPKVDTVATAVVYTPAEGDVIFRNGKVLVWHSNAYVVTDKDVTLESGVVVKPNGEVVRDDETVTLNDGEAVSATGRFFNKAGNVIEDGWQGAKKGVKKAGEGIKKAAKKTGEAVKSVVD
ncbi:MAG: DUF6799 domain-containing protein [Ferruginibacter sp.]